MKIRKNIFAILCASVLLACASLAVCAESKDLEYKGTWATATLTPTFQWVRNGNDKATAKTKFVISNPNYRVAVRLERWDSKTTMGDFKYNNDKTLAQCNYTWTDVYAFQSRHSIDNSNDTVELAVDTCNAQE
ncbi:hypothetical protein SAMN02745687_01543 [Lachnospiraceae bacterium NK3A20]|nr:hypothetical protein SAMN02745687_01543 [Lachnospiraceae bacterium NK3A20]